MTHGSLFSGIGGFDLAARWCGWENVFQCEIDPFCRRVLKHHFKDTELYEDIKKTDFTRHRGAVGVISGGFPCQPFSTAGKRKGAADDRFLWPEMLRAIREVQPAWVVAENVGGLLTQQQGVVFERVCADLEGAGYEVQPLVIPACAVGAPHRRDRVWIVAHAAKNPDGDGRAERKPQEGAAALWQQRHAGAGGANGVYIPAGAAANANGADGARRGLAPAGSPHGAAESQGAFAGIGCAFDFGAERAAAHAQSERLHERSSGIPKVFNASGNAEAGGLCSLKAAPHAAGTRLQRTMQQNAKLFTEHIPDWRGFPAQPPVCGRDDGLPGGLDGITLPKWRGESIRALGNAIVPQVAYQIFKAISRASINDRK